MKLVTREQMNLIDANASKKYGIPSIILMEHAAHEMYLQISETRSNKERFLFVCGSGNNGGDGFALARLLTLKNYNCAIILLGKEDSLTEDAKINWAICKNMKIKILEDVHDFSNYDVIVDCIFGTGLCRNIEGIYADWINRINTSQKYIISVDIPSGIDSDSAKVWGCAIKADLTYTMQCGKSGLYVYPGREYAGKVKVLDIFIPKSLIDECSSKTYLIRKEEMKSLLPKRAMHSNKGNYGKVLCVGGSNGMSGAISLAARSALSVGCGLLTCAIPKCIQNAVQMNVMESMSLLLPDYDGHISCESAPILQEKRNDYSIILIGCGIGRSKDIESVLAFFYESEKPLVIDADGLFALQKMLRNRKQTIITPHLKEFASLMKVEVKEMVEHTLYYVDIFTTKFPDITLVLKSETTIIAKGEERFINTYGNNGLATGGSGDVLAGIVTGLYAQNNDPLKAAILAVFLHSYSADEIIKRKSVYSLLPSDIIEHIEKNIFNLI